MAISVSVSSVTFSDGSKQDFGANDIVVFVGPNNSGKSATLREIQAKACDPKQSGFVLQSLAVKCDGSTEELTQWLVDHCVPMFQNPKDPSYHRYGTGCPSSQAQNWWRNYQNGLGELAKMCFFRLGTEERLQTSVPAGSIDVTREEMKHPVHALQLDDELELKCSAYFKHAFGTDLTVHRGAGSVVPLICGPRPLPDKERGEDRVSSAYIRRLAVLPRLELQGDGMRAFAGILLYTLVGGQFGFLIDEPEAFLHPPQARLLGRFLAKETSSNQLFIATHSNDIIRGMLDARTSRIRVIRITREGAVNRIAHLSNEELRKFWADPLLRFSNIVDGLFHEKVLVCEGDSDCRFYNAVLDEIQEEGVKNKDVMFTHCGGKGRIPMVARALRSIRVPVGVSVDMDCLSAEQPLRDIVDAMGGKWAEIETDWKAVKTAVDSKKPELEAAKVREQILEILESITLPTFPKDKSQEIGKILRRASPWAIVKETGSAYVPAGDATNAFRRLDSKLRELGIFVVGVGELENFCKSIGGHGPAWVSAVLESKNLRGEEELEDARKYVRELVGLAEPAPND